MRCVKRSVDTTRGGTRVATRPPAAKAPGNKENIRTWPDFDCSVTTLPRSPTTRPVNPEARWTTPSPTTASTSGCRLALARALSRGSARTSAQGSGVRLTATTVSDDPSRPADGPALLIEHSGSVSPWTAQRALMGIFLAVAALDGGMFVPLHRERRGPTLSWFRADAALAVHTVLHRSDRGGQA